MALNRKFRDDDGPKLPKEQEDLFADVAGPIKHMGIRIVVCDRGYVHIGYVAYDTVFFYVRKAQNIRRWGTTAGLGQLKDGPRQETVLDPYGSLQIPMHAVLFFVDVDASKWEGVLE